MGQATRVRSSGEARPDAVLVPMALQPKHTTYEALMTSARRGYTLNARPHANVDAVTRHRTR